MATPIGRPVSPTYTPATPPAARVAPPASSPPALETSKPVQSQETFGAARQSVVGKSTETVNPSHGGQQIKQGIDRTDEGQLIEQAQMLVAHPVLANEFADDSADAGKGVELSGTRASISQIDTDESPQGLFSMVSDNVKFKEIDKQTQTSFAPLIEYYQNITASCLPTTVNDQLTSLIATTLNKNITTLSSCIDDAFLTYQQGISELEAIHSSPRESNPTHEEIMAPLNLLRGTIDKAFEQCQSEITASLKSIPQEAFGTTDVESQKLQITQLRQSLTAGFDNLNSLRQEAEFLFQLERSEKPFSKNNDLKDKLKQAVAQFSIDLQAPVTLNPAQKEELAKDITAKLLANVDNQSLHEPIKNCLVAMLSTMSPQDLISPQIQGLGGSNLANANAQGIGTGAAGHYVNSPLSSIQQLIQNPHIQHQETFKTLTMMTTVTLAPNLQEHMGDIIRGTLQEIAFPESINQHSRGTCAATTAQIALAVKNPEKYINIVSSLVSQAGSCPSTLVPLNKDIEMKRVTDTDLPDNSGRSISSRIIQSAFMQYAKGAEKYENTSQGGGLVSRQTECLMKNLFSDKSWQLVEKDFGAIGLPPAVKQTLEKGIPVSTGLGSLSSGGRGGHRILITGIDEQKIYFMNPWGKLQQMPIEDSKFLTSFITESSQISASDSLLPSGLIATLHGNASKTEEYNTSMDKGYYDLREVIKRANIPSGPQMDFTRK
ncbi:MAG: papain-like cysteine protease family protein [Candidatus Sericytochromatia bacterium]